MVLGLVCFSCKILKRIGSTAPSGWGKKHCDKKLKECERITCNMRIAGVQYASCFLRLAFFFSAYFMLELMFMIFT